MLDPHTRRIGLAVPADRRSSRSKPVLAFCPRLLPPPCPAAPPSFVSLAMSGDGWIVLQLHDSLCAQGDHVSTHTTLEGAKSAAAAAGCIFINESSGNKFSVRAVDDPQHAILVPSPGGPWKVHARIPSNPVGVKLLLDLPPAPSSPVATRVDNSESGLRGRLDAALAEGDFMEAATISAQLTSRHEEQHGPIELGIEEQDAEDAALAALARARLEDAMERAANPDTKTQSVMINWCAPRQHFGSRGRCVVLAGALRRRCCCTSG